MVLCTAIDITVRRRMEEEVRASGRLLKTVFDSVPRGMFVKDKEDRYLIVNRAYSQLYGLEPHQLENKRTMEIQTYSAEAKRAVLEHDRLVLSEGKTIFGIEREHVLPSGEPCTLVTSKSPYRDEKGEVIGLVGIVEDVTERKKSKEQLSRFKTTLDMTLDSVFMFDPVTLKFFYCNEGAKRQVGYGEEELMEMTPLDLKPELDEENFRKMLAPLQAGEAASHTCQTLQRSKGGKDIPVDIFLQHIAPPGETARFVAIVRDISERERIASALRESEQRLYHAQKIANLGSWDWNILTDDLTWSDETYRIFGQEPQAFRATYEAFQESVHPEDRELVLMRAVQALESGSPYEVEHRVVWPDGSERIVLEQREIFRTPDGRPIRIIGTLQDITERKQVESDLRNSNVAMEAAIQELESFSYAVSHDLRAPLRGMDGFSQAMLEDYHNVLDERGKDYLGRIRNGAQRLSRLIDDLLKLSRVTRQELHKERIDFSAAALEVVGRMQESQPERRVNFALTPEISVMGDRALLRIALENLIGNAWKFTSKTSDPAIELGTEQAKGEQVFFVRDNGAGFDMAYADKLFGAFQRLHGAGDFPGTGIGLATVQRIIHKHGGRIWAEAAENQGATFYFTL